MLTPLVNLQEIEVELPVYEEKCHGVESLCDAIQADPHIEPGDKPGVAAETGDLKDRWDKFAGEFNDSKDRSVLQSAISHMSYYNYLSNVRIQQRDFQITMN